LVPIQQSKKQVYFSGAGIDTGLECSVHMDRYSPVSIATS